MSSCHDMKIGDIYICEGCGIELHVVQECEHSHVPAEDCACHSEGEKGGFFCCNKPLVKKES